MKLPQYKSLDKNTIIFLIVIESMYSMWKKKEEPIPKLIVISKKRLTFHEKFLVFVLVILFIITLRKIIKLIKNKEKFINLPIPFIKPKKRQKFLFAEFNHFIELNNYVLLCQNIEEFKTGQVGKIIETISPCSGYIDFDIPKPKLKFNIDEVLKNSTDSQVKVVLIFPLLISHTSM